MNFDQITNDVEHLAVTLRAAASEALRPWPSKRMEIVEEFISDLLTSIQLAATENAKLRETVHRLAVNHLWVGNATHRQQLANAALDQLAGLNIPRRSKRRDDQ